MTAGPEWKSVAFRRARLRAAAVVSQGGVCIYCKSRFDISLPATLEHIIPLSKGGDDHPENVSASCGPCNNERGRASHGAFLRFKRKMVENGNE